MARVYVASKFENKAEVRRAQALLRGAGHEVTFDWTVHDDSHLPLEERPAYQAMCAMLDRDGVLAADMVLLLGHPLMKGALVEAGMALGLGRPVFVVDRHLQENVFWELRGGLVRHHNSVEAAVAAIGFYQETHALAVSDALSVVTGRWERPNTVAAAYSVPPVPLEHSWDSEGTPVPLPPPTPAEVGEGD